MRRWWNSNKKKMFVKILIPIVITVLVQVTIYITLLIQGGTVSLIKTNALDIFEEQTLNRAQSMETDMVRKWANLSDVGDAIEQTISSILQERGLEPGAIADHAELNQEIIDQTFDRVEYLLRRNSVTGAYLILDGAAVQGKSSEEERAGLYLEDQDPASYSSDNSDILALRGLPAVLKKRGVSFDSYWKAGFDCTAEEENGRDAYFFQPMKAAEKNPEADTKNLGYWGKAVRLDGFRHVITYSIPLMLPEYGPVGVLGIDISADYLRSMLGGAQDKAYALAWSEDGETYYINGFGGALYSRHFGDSLEVKKAGDVNESLISVLSPRDNKTELYVNIQPLQVYGNNTPFENQKWVILGIQEKQVLLSHYNMLYGRLLAVSVLFVLLGVACALLISRVITHPIARVMATLRESDGKGRIHLEQVGIEEVDELTELIEAQSNALLENASKVSRIIDLNHLPLGVLEYIKGSNQVFCSKNVSSLLGWEEEREKDFYLEMDEFDRRMREFSREFEKTGDNEYVLSARRNGRECWLQLHYWLKDGNMTGSILDITSDVEERKRIEHERDFDALTEIFNRRAFLAKLADLEREGKDSLKSAAMIMWDLDNLKRVNDTYGHEYGDFYIQRMAECLGRFPLKHALVARRSGDEFYTFLYGFHSGEELMQAVQTVWQEIQETSIEVPEGCCRLSVSGGIAWYAEDSDKMDDLIRYADFALYEVKKSGKNRLNRFDREIWNKTNTEE